MNAISLFSCIGVAECYFKDLGINVIVASDIDKRRCDVHKFLYPDIAMVSFLRWKVKRYQIYY